MDSETLDATVEACKELIWSRFPDDSHRGAAAVLLADGSILAGTSPDFINPSTSVCHEVETVSVGATGVGLGFGTRMGWSRRGDQGRLRIQEEGRRTGR